MSEVRSRTQLDFCLCPSLRGLASSNPLSAAWADDYLYFEHHDVAAAAFNFVDEDMSGCLDSEEWRRFLDRFKSNVAVINMRSMFLHLDKVCIVTPRTA